MDFGITENALKKLIELRPAASDVLHIGIEAGGCSGMSYKMRWRSSTIDFEVQIEVGDAPNSVVLATDKKSALFLDGVTLNYSEGLDGRGFEWTNPKAKRTCGCGSSFGL